MRVLIQPCLFAREPQDGGQRLARVADARGNGGLLVGGPERLEASGGPCQWMGAVPPCAQHVDLLGGRRVGQQRANQHRLGKAFVLAEIRRAGIQRIPRLAHRRNLATAEQVGQAVGGEHPRVQALPGPLTYVVHELEQLCQKQVAVHPAQDRLVKLPVVVGFGCVQALSPRTPVERTHG
jgi:hypothetical protein